MATVKNGEKKNSSLGSKAVIFLWFRSGGVNKTAPGRVTGVNGIERIGTKHMKWVQGCWDTGHKFLRGQNPVKNAQ